MKNLTVPVNQKALEELDCDSCSKDDLEEISLSDQEYQELWHSGIFNLFNEVLDLMIDDYEDEVITGVANLALAKKLTLRCIAENPQVHALKKLLKQIELAEEYQTGLFFYF